LKFDGGEPGGALTFEFASPLGAHSPDDIEGIVAERTRFGKGDLRSVALYQKITFVCILVYIFALVSQFLMPPIVRLFLDLAFVSSVVIAAAFAFLLATKLFSTRAAVLYGILTLVPLIGLILLFIINGEATTVLREHGIRVGLLGANMSDLDRLGSDGDA
jgi:hypothetical protein